MDGRGTQSWVVRRWPVLAHAGFARFWMMVLCVNFSAQIQTVAVGGALHCGAVVDGELFGDVFDGAGDEVLAGDAEAEGEGGGFGDGAEDGAEEAELGTGAGDNEDAAGRAGSPPHQYVAGSPPHQ